MYLYSHESICIHAILISSRILFMMLIPIREEGVGSMLTSFRVWVIVVFMGFFIFLNYLLFFFYC
jgi:hypothetical protein